MAILTSQDLEMTIRVTLAVAIGAIPGGERERHGSPAGQGGSISGLTAAASI